MSFQILVVDDTKFMRKMLTDILKQYGHEVVGEAENGRQAVQKYEELQPDIVLMDITMPEMDGIEAMKEIRLLNPSAVVLICSAMSQQDLISDALKAGANGYVMKPFKPNRVNEIVRKYGVPRVIGHLIPQDMQRTEVVHAKIETAQEVVETEVLESQTLEVEGAHIEVDTMNAVELSYTEPTEVLSSEVHEEVMNEVVPEVAQEQEVVPEPEIKQYVIEDRKTYVKPPQVVNALEVLLAFAEVEESKSAQEEQEIMETPSVQSEEERLAEMEKLAAAMQGDLEQEWQLEQQGIAAASQQEDAGASDAIFMTAQPIEEMAEVEVSSMAFSLDELNELTMEMAAFEPVGEIKTPVIEIPVVPVVPSMPSMPAAQVEKEEVPISTSYKSQESTDMNKGLKAVNGGKIINLFRGIGPMKNFTSSVMCNWSEELNGEMSQYLVVCTEAENKIEIEMAVAGGQKQSITVTIESFNQLAAWLQVQLGTAPVNNREYAKKADF
jgi:DNA-binding NarL/FixJ family response regulator